MTGLVYRWRGFFAHVRAFVPYGFEVALTLLSAQVAWVLFTHPLYFEQRAEQYAFMTRHLFGQEWQLGLVAAAAAALKAAGLLCLVVRRDPWMDTAFVLREAGWGLSFVFWTCLGVTYWMAAASSIGAGTVLTLGVFSLGMMVAGPVMPEDADADG